MVLKNLGKQLSIFWIIYAVSFGLLFTSISKLQASCGPNTRTWNGGTNQSWSNNNNWTIANHPDTSAENALIPSAARPCRANQNRTVSCVEVTDGELRSRTSRTLTVVGDYFKAPNVNSLDVNPTHDWTIALNGSGAQDFEVVDPVNFIDISNNTTINFKRSFEIRNDLTFQAAANGLTLNIEQTLTYSGTNEIIIPAGVTINLLANATLKLTTASLTVNGTLVVKEGAKIQFGDGLGVSVPSGGLLKLEGVSGNVATLEGNGSVEWDIDIAGSFWGNYFRIDRAGKNLQGMNVTGEIQKMDNGEFHFIPAGGMGMTWGSTATLPDTLNTIGFFDDAGTGTASSIDASSFNVKDVAIEDWSGLGCAIEQCSNENDPNARVNWGTQAGFFLQLGTNNNTGKPADPVTAGAAADEFAIFTFALTKNGSSTDITQITFTLDGNATAADVDYVQVFTQGASCQTVGPQIGTNLALTGSPATGTISIPTGSVTVNGTTASCVHVWLKTTDSAENGQTIGLLIDQTAHVTNSADFQFSSTSGPPKSGGTVTINGDITRVWRGKNSSNWRVNANWLNGGWPNNNDNCRIGTGVNDLVLSANEECQNMDLINGGLINWNNGAYDLTVFGALDVEVGYNFQNAANGRFIMGAAANQTMDILTPFPNNVQINNTGGVGANIVSINSGAHIMGDLEVFDGVLRVSDGASLTVDGDINIRNGGTLDIEGGATVYLGSANASVTVDSGGSLQILGTSSKQAIMTATGTANYEVTINGSISARYYSFGYLGSNGLQINSGATIDATNHLQNGTFTHPAVSNMAFLRLFIEIPGDQLSDMAFDQNGSSATNVTNIHTNIPAAVDLLSVDPYSGDLSGESFDNETGYVAIWGTPTNTIKILNQAGPESATLSPNTTYVMGRWGFQQLAGVGFSNTDIGSLTLSLYGTGSAGDISNVKIYEDINCDSAGGSLIGNGTLSGNPPLITFTGITGVTVEASSTGPAINCIYVTADISSNAANGKTVGFKINDNTHFQNTLNYSIDGSTPVPRELGLATIQVTATTWTGNTDSDWFTSTNWTNGVPDANTTCTIPAGSNNAIISSIQTASCSSVSITNGNVTINASADWDVYGGFANTGTFTNNGNLNIRDDGVTQTVQTINSNSALTGVMFNKTTGGSSKVAVDGTNLTINNFAITSGNNFIFEVPNGKKLIAPNGMTITSGEFRIMDAGTVEIGSGQTVLVNGGLLNFNGQADATPQNLATKAKMTVQGGGSNRWTFNATSGSVRMNGFLIENLTDSGFQLNGTAALTKLDGGQFRNFSTNYASVRAMQFNTTGSITTTSTNVGWNWGPLNAEGASSTGYLIGYSSGCANQTIDFSGWFGDWYDNQPTFDVQNTVVSDTNCNINLNASASPVTLLTFVAVPYDAAVDIRWQTGLESNHYGFNVFRSNADGTEFQQINPEVLRNFFTSTLFYGDYRFIDHDVVNGQKYYYYIEDIALNLVDTELHGPVSATPMAGLGAPPGDTASQTSGQNTNLGGATSNDPSTIPNTSFKDLGNGVVILSQTSQSIRLKITPAVPTYAASAWNGAYETISIGGYNKTQVAGHPEILERYLLIEAYEFATSATLTNILSTVTATDTSHLLQPAPAWSVNGGGTLVASYTPDTTIYTTNTSSPTQYLEVQENLETVGSKKFLKLKINPLQYNPVSQTVYRVTELIVDIGLNGDAWNISTPIATASIAPGIVTNTLRMSYNKTGVYEVAYTDLQNSSVEGPFKNVDVNDLRLYYYGQQIPLQVFSGSGFFSNGDKIRFYAPYTKTIEDTRNEVVLSTVPINGEVGAALRMPTLDADPALSSLSTENTIRYTARAEQDQIALFSEPLSDYHDHFYWKMIVGPIPGNPLEYLDIPIDLSHLNESSGTDLTLKVWLAGRAGFTAEIKHHLVVYANSYPPTVGSVEFFGEGPRQLSFTIPQSLFFDGVNTIRLRVTGSNAPAGDFDFLYLDRIQVDYDGRRKAVNGTASISNTYTNTVVTVSEFDSSSVTIYDTSEVDQTSILNNAVVTPNGGTWDITFNTPEGSENLNGENYLIYDATATYLKPIAMTLSLGYSKALKETDQGADFIIIGHRQLIDEGVPDLITAREAQGMRVKAVTLDQIYAEFSNGVKSSQAIKDFLRFAQLNWEAPAPQYILLLGDATYDPRDRFGYGATPYSMPMPIEKGRFYDFGADNWFVAFDNASILPTMAIGRLPSNNVNDIKNYVEKVLAYEAGTSAPTTGIKDVFFVAGKDKNLYEHFKAKTQNLSNLDLWGQTQLTTSMIAQEDYANPADVTTAITNAINNGTFLINYFGHGGFSKWDDANIMTNALVEALANTELPIIMTLNCLNTYHYDADSSFVTIGEKFIFNANAGAIAFFGSTTMTTPPAQNSLAQAFYDELAKEIKLSYHQVRLGDILQRSKNAVGYGEYEKDVVKSFTLFGDPTLVLPQEIFNPEPPRATSNSDAGGGGGGGGFGCSSGGATFDRLQGRNFNKGWDTGGFLETLILYYLLAFCLRRKRRRQNKSC